MTKELGRKQSLSDQARWNTVRASARQVWPDDRLDNLIDRTIGLVSEVVADHPRAAFAWSGGKDSLALEYVMRLAGIEPCVLGISQLEYPATLRWVTDNMPPGLTVISTGQDLAWLREHPEMLFPQGSWGSRWFTIINHRAQETYFRDESLDVLILGRRKMDGNFCGPNGLYTNGKGITRYSPLMNWSHEAVFSLIDREGLTLPPCYGWPRGYQVGTGSWPARQWTDSIAHGFEEVWQIDPDMVRQAAAAGIDRASFWLSDRGLT